MSFKVNDYSLREVNSANFRFVSLLNGCQLLKERVSSFNLIALRKAKIVYNFGLYECNWVKRKFSLL